MLGILFIIAIFIVGYIILKLFLPDVTSNLKTLSGNTIDLPNFMIIIPSSFFIGTIALTWITYIFSYLSRNTGHPLFYANIVNIIILTIILFIGKMQGYHIDCSPDSRRNGIIRLIHNDTIEKMITYKLELLYILIVTLFWSILIIRSFNISNGDMNVGFSVFSDFGPHLSMIRSFSLGSNFPTEYPHFPDGVIRYHFLFQFLVGNLEFLGLRIDLAFNLISILSIVCFFMLLYSFVVILFNNRWIAVITTFLCTFRSSFAIFTFINDNGSIKKAFSKLLEIKEHIGTTTHEEWGLWAQKVFVNQRHLPFSLGILLFTLIALYPLFNNTLHSIKGYSNSRDKLHELFFSSDSWMCNNIASSVFIGLILGLSGFFNGAVLIATLPILFILCVMSKNKMDYINVILISAALFVIQVIFFSGLGSSSDSIKLTLGFLANTHTAEGILEYYILLLGILPVVLITGLFFVPKGARWLALSFTMPFIIANTLQLTPDITVNHKYIIISVMLLNIIAVYVIFRLFISKKAVILCKLFAIILLITLTLTGFADLRTLYNLDKNYIKFNIHDSTLDWVKNNTNPHDVFLTNQDSLNQILLSGRKIFYGWPYYAWSAGYDIEQRKDIVKQIFNGKDSSTIKELVKENNISYIVIEQNIRKSTEFKLNEELIKNTFDLAFFDNKHGLYIYATGNCPL